MSPSTTFPGRMVSPGVATGQVYLGQTVTVGSSRPAPAGPGTPDEVRAAFAAVAAERFALAERLRTESRAKRPGPRSRPAPMPWPR